MVTIFKAINFYSPLLITTTTERTKGTLINAKHFITLHHTGHQAIVCFYAAIWGSFANKVVKSTKVGIIKKYSGYTIIYRTETN